MRAVEPNKIFFAMFSYFSDLVECCVFFVKKKHKIRIDIKHFIS